MRMMLMMFFKLAIIANLFAWLVSYVGLSKWLQMLAYRLELDLFPFFIAAMASILAIIIAVGIKTARHAAARPAKALRYE